MRNAPLIVTLAVAHHDPLTRHEQAGEIRIGPLDDRILSLAKPAAAISAEPREGKPAASAVKSEGPYRHEQPLTRGRPQGMAFDPEGKARGQWRTLQVPTHPHRPVIVPGKADIVC